MPPRDSFSTAALLTAMVAFGPISTDLYLPSLPGIARDLGTDAASVQLTLSVFLLGFAAGQIVYGPLSDRHGRRSVLLGGVLLYLIGSFACAAAASIEWLIAARFLQAIGACSGVVLSRAIVRDIYAPERAASVLAYMGSAMALAPLIGPVIGGQLEVLLGWRANFALLTLYGVVIAVAVLVMLEETNRRRDVGALSLRRIVANFRQMLSSRRYVAAVAAASFCYCGMFSFISASSFVLITVLGIDPDAYGFCFATVVIGYMIGALSAGRVVQRLGMERVVLAGGALTGVSGPVMAVLAVMTGAEVHWAMIVLPMAAYCAGMGWVIPASNAAAIGPYPDKAGAASSLLGFIQMVMAASVGITVAHLLDGTARPMAIAIALSGLATLGAALAVRRTAQPRRQMRPS